LISIINLINNHNIIIITNNNNIYNYNNYYYNYNYNNKYNNNFNIKKILRLEIILKGYKIIEQRSIKVNLKMLIGTSKRIYSIRYHILISNV